MTKTDNKKTNVFDVKSKQINPATGLSYRKEALIRYNARKEVVLKKYGR